MACLLLSRILLIFFAVKVTYFGVFQQFQLFEMQHLGILHSAGSVLCRVIPDGVRTSVPTHHFDAVRQLIDAPPMN